MKDMEKDSTGILGKTFPSSLPISQGLAVPRNT